MSSTDPQDQTAAPSTELEVMGQRVDWLRGQLDTVRADAQRAAELAVRRDVGPLDEWVRVVADYDQFANAICRTEFVPDGFRGRPESTTAAMMYGREVGLPPMTTLQNMFVVNGKVGMYAEQLRAMVLAAGHEFVIDEMTSHVCTVSAKRKDSTRWSTFTYTMEQAKLTPAYQKNPNYKQRPVEMLFARVTGLMCHAIYPDVIRGMGVLEELQDVTPQEATEDAVPVQATEEKATRTVARKKATPKAAVEAKPPAAPVEIPDETLPPLPGEEPSSDDLANAREMKGREERAQRVEPESSPAGSTPGEGRTAEPSTPAGPAPLTTERVAEIHDVPEDMLAAPGKPRCPVISMGVQCRYQVHDESSPHTFGGGMGDPVELRRCGFAEKHVAHAYEDDKLKVWACSGEPLDAQTGWVHEGAKERHCSDFDSPHPAHTWPGMDDEGHAVTWGCVGVEGAPDTARVAPKPEKLAPGTNRLMQARFKELGFTDSEDDRAARLRTAAVLGDVPGYELDSFNSLTGPQAQQILRVLGPCKDRGDVIDLLARAAQEDTP